jgi:hypothetical protein
MVGFSDVPAKSVEGATCFEGAVPIERVRDELFGFRVTRVPYRYLWNQNLKTDDKSFAVVREDTGELMARVSAKYEVHQYSDWLLDLPAEILKSSDLVIAEAATFDRGRWASIRLRVPDTLVSATVDYQPELYVTTSHNKSHASKFKALVLILVCSNGLMALENLTKTVYHLKGQDEAKRQIGKVLELFTATQKRFDELIAKLVEAPATELLLVEIAKALFGIKDTAGERDSKHPKLEKVLDLYHNDHRCVPWKGTKFGVFQALSTYDHYFTRSDGVRWAKNSRGIAYGGREKTDQKILKLLDQAH